MAVRVLGTKAVKTLGTMFTRCSVPWPSGCSVPWPSGCSVPRLSRRSVPRLQGARYHGHQGARYQAVTVFGTMFTRCSVPRLIGTKAVPGSTDLGTPSTVGTSLDAAESPRATASRRRQMRRMSRASSVSATCDRDSVDSATAAAAADSTLQLRFKSLVRRQGSSFRMAAGLLVSHCRRRSTGFSSGADSLGDISIGASSLRSVQTERKAVKVLGTMFMISVPCLQGTRHPGCQSARYHV